MDHGLRAESAAEAAAVEAICADLGVPHATLTVSVPPGNLQANARAERYQALGLWARRLGLAAVATAHHADDQAETLLMRLNRGSGAAGLAGARPRGSVPGLQVPIARPLLSWRRADLAKVVEQAGLSALEDPGNADDRFERARMRKALAKASWLDVPALGKSAAHLADADEALDWAAEQEWLSQVICDKDGAVYRPQAPRAIALRVIARIIGQLADARPRGSAVARLHDALRAGRPATLAEIAARPVRDGWRFRKAPPRRPVRPKAR